MAGLERRLAAAVEGAGALAKRRESLSADHDRALGRSATLNALKRSLNNAPPAAVRTDGIRLVGKSLQASRASAPRERKPVIPPKPEKQSKASDAPHKLSSTPAEITDYDSLIALLRSRADELEISRATIDHITGLPDRLSNKILGLSQIRRIGMATLGPILDALGLKLIAVPDDAALRVPGRRKLRPSR